MNEVGDRVELISCSDTFVKIPAGTQGTVTYIDSLTRAVTVAFDNGLTLGLIPNEDRWRTLPKTAGSTE